MLYGIQTTQTSWSTTTALLQEEVGNMLKKKTKHKNPHYCYSLVCLQRLNTTLNLKFLTKQQLQQSNKSAKLLLRNWLFKVSGESSYFKVISQSILEYVLKYIFISGELLTNQLSLGL